MKTPLTRYMLIWGTAIIVLTFLVAGKGFCARVTGQDEPVTTSGSQQVDIKKKDTQTRPDEKSRASRKTRNTAKNPVAVRQNPAAASSGEAVSKEVKKKSAAVSDDSRYVTIDFEDVDIRVFVKFISELTGKNFVVDRNVKGTVTIVSPRKISVDEAYKVFESVLEVNDYTAVPAGDIIKIIPYRSAKEKNVQTLLRQQAVSPEDKVVTQIVSLQYANPDEMRKVLTPLVSKASVILSYSPTGMLIITDVLSNIKRLLKIINALDAEGIEEQIAVIPLQYADAVEIGKSLGLIFQQTGGAKKGGVQTTIKIVPDERTNTLITLASENDTARIRDIIALLDREVPRGEAKIRVFHLQNADAEELTQVLMDIPTADKDAKKPQKESSPVLSKGVKIVPDKATNTLIITAGRDDYKILEEVITELDIPRPMVYIEALIMEVNVDKTFQLGVEWVVGDDFTKWGQENVVGGGFSGGNILPTPSATTGAVSLPSGLSVGVFGEAITIGGITYPSLGAILQAYRKDSDVHILSTPQLLTLDNEEAEIYVGENVPYQTRQDTSSTDRDYSTYEYKDVGTTLRLTPQISQERFVRLDIFQETTKLVDRTEDRPRTLKRTAKTAVTIKDTNTIVIGGLIGDDISNNVVKVPLLGDIPILGWLFRYEGETRERRNLFIFITPHILESPVEAKALYDEKHKVIDSVVEGGVIKRYQK